MDFPILLVKNLPYNPDISSLYSLFGKYGNINQVRIPESRSNNLGTGFIVYNNFQAAKKAANELNGVNFDGRYIVVSLYHVDKSKLVQEDLQARKLELENLKANHGIS
jgi:pre-mRNA branch site protein p14